MRWLACVLLGCGARDGLLVDLPSRSSTSDNEPRYCDSARGPRTLGDGRFLVNASLVNGLALDATYVYTTGPARVSKAGGGLVTLVFAGTSPEDVAVDETHVYWNEGGSVRRVVKNGGSIELFTARGNGGPAGLALDAANVYFGDTGGSAIWSTRKTDVGGSALFEDRQDHVQSIVVDGSTLYWTLGYSTPGRERWRGDSERQ